ncbi:hypothetical protein C1645_738812 [Glomus cerebriforme]|uniref:Uncharacterized protein n=1 Tax=Glomus cerebriforme TaxID=658196 RepID=A0A397SSZ2_9GLOM|nr:hypothetical protein C1645_738812 [Glomus cerebriforme]
MYVVDKYDAFILPNSSVCFSEIGNAVEVIKKFKNGFIQMTERLYKDGEFKARRHSLYIYCTIFWLCTVKVWLIIVMIIHMKMGCNPLDKIQAKDVPAYDQYNPALYDHYTSQS